MSIKLGHNTSIVQNSAEYKLKWGGITYIFKKLPDISTTDTSLNFTFNNNRLSVFIMMRASDSNDNIVNCKYNDINFTHSKGTVVIFDEQGDISTVVKHDTSYDFTITGSVIFLLGVCFGALLGSVRK